MKGQRERSSGKLQKQLHCRLCSLIFLLPGPPTEVKVNLVIKSMGPISEKDEVSVSGTYFV